MPAGSAAATLHFAVDPQVLEIVGSFHLDKVVAQAKSGLAVARSVLSFFTQYRKEQHGQAVMLQKISTDEDKLMRTLPVPDRMLGSLTATLEVVGYNNQLAELQLKYAAEIDKLVVTPFESFLVAQQQLCDNAENNNVQMLLAMKALVDEVQAKKVLANEAIAELNKAKKKKDYEKRGEKAKEHILAYKEALRAANEIILTTRQTEAPAAVMQILNMERLRVESMGVFFESYGKLQAEFHKNQEAIVANIRASCGKFDQVADVSEFVGGLREGGKLVFPPTLEYSLTPLSLPDDVDEKDELLFLLAPGPLEDMVAQEEKRIPCLRKQNCTRGEMALPFAFDVLARAVDENVQVDNVFLATVPKPKTIEILNQLEGGAPDLSKYTPLETSAAIKAWLRQLSPPLIPPEHEKGCFAVGRAAIKAPNDTDPAWAGVRSACQTVAKKLPKIRAEILRRFSTLLARVVEAHHGERGFGEQLAAACSSCLFAVPEGEPAKLSEFFYASQNFLATMIRVHSPDVNKYEPGEKRPVLDPPRWPPILRGLTVPAWNPALNNGGWSPEPRTVVRPEDSIYASVKNLTLNKFTAQLYSQGSAAMLKEKEEPKSPPRPPPAADKSFSARLPAPSPKDYEASKTGSPIGKVRRPFEKDASIIQAVVNLMACPEALEYVATICDAPFRATVHPPSVDSLNLLLGEGQKVEFGAVPGQLKDQLPNLLKKYVAESNYKFGGDPVSDNNMARICHAIISEGKNYRTFSAMTIAFPAISTIEPLYVQIRDAS